GAQPHAQCRPRPGPRAGPRVPRPLGTPVDRPPRTPNSYRWCCILRLSSPGPAGWRFGPTSGAPWMLLKGTVRAKVGRFFDRTWVVASKPDARRIRVGSLNAEPKKLIPSGTPKVMPAGTCTIG